MTLSKSRIVAQGTSPHPHEHAALEFLREALPDHDPFQLWAFVELRAPDGHLYELDALVLTRTCLFLIEIKSWQGTIRAADDGVDLAQVLPDGRILTHRNPFDLTNLKAKVLASLLERKLGPRRPHVQPLVFFSSGVFDVHGPAGAGIVGTKKLASAVTKASFYGAPTWLAGRTYEASLREIVAALKAIGLSESRASLKVGDLLVGDLIEDGPGYQDRMAQHPLLTEHKRRARLYLVPQAATDEHREQLRGAAEREFRLLTVLGDHRYILKAPDFHMEGPHGGPIVVFEYFDGGVPLDVFLRHHPDLPLADRVTILEQIGEALAYCHEKNVVHRGLHPGAVLVKRSEKGAIETRLYNFQLAASQGLTSGTVHHTIHTVKQAELYRAPELLENPQIDAPTCDVFSLGVVAWFVLVGRPPAQTLADRQKLLDTLGCLPLSIASDDLAGGWDWRAQLTDDTKKGFDETIQAATALRPLNRYDDVREWIDFLVDVTTRPETPVAADPDPLTARKGDALAGKLTVLRVLGTGSTARVLLVERDGRELALKVALDADCQERLQDEADVLRRLAKRDGVVELIETVTLGGRLGLLMTHAGLSLADRLAKHGPPTLDLASRWGEDLLQALRVLEEEGVQHRDIKPANVGTGGTAAKEALHLTLFNFSLAGIPADRVTAGTPAYRDPFLVRRGRWDTAADRYAAALTLHELLTGVLPRYGKGDGPAIATDEEVTLEAERFDAGVRAPLQAFFERSLARDVAQRFPCAEDMLQAWRQCFAETTSTTTGHGDELEDGVSIAAFDFTRVTADTPVDSLPLSVRARNALDRSGAHTVRDLLGLSRNRLSFIRGVGKDTREHILDVLDAILKARPDLADETVRTPYLAGWRGIDVGIAHVSGLSQEAAAALEDADLGRLSRVARAAKDRVERLLARFPGEQAALDAAFQGHGLERLLLDAPSTIEGWVAKLLPPGSDKRGEGAQRTVRVLLGLDSHGGFYVEGDDQAAHAARLLAVSRQAVYAALLQRKEAWLGQASLGLLQGAVEAALDSLGGAAPLEQVAQALPDQLPHASDAAPDAQIRNRRALVRLCAELRGDVGQLRLNHTVWLVRSPELRTVLDALGKRADELAQRETLPSPQDVREQLAALTVGTSLESLPPEKLVRMAAWASGKAAASARLELYPRGMDADRALRLCSGALSAAEFSLNDLQALVAARYADAKPLPDRPALDALLKPYRLTWTTSKNKYVRENAPGETHSRTQWSNTQKPHRTSQTPKAPQTEGERERAEFEHRLRVAIEQHSFKALRVSAWQSEDVAHLLERRFDLKAVSLEDLFLRHLQLRAAKYGIDHSALLHADREGSAGAAWTNLRDLAGEVAEDMRQELSQQRGTVLLTRPGLVARYQLDGFLEGLVDLVRRQDDLGVLLLVPSADSEAGLVIHGVPKALAVPALLHVHKLDVPKSWVREQFPAPAAA